MKKYLMILLVGIISFFGIDSVEAITVSDGTYSGTCTLKEETNTTCMYNCTHSSDDFNITFDYSVFVNDDGDIGQYYISDTIIGGIKENYFYRIINLKDKPVKNYFVNNGNFYCSPLVFTDEVSVGTKSIPINISVSTVQVVTENDISIQPDPSFTPENRPDYSQEEIDTSCGFLGGHDSEIVIFLQKIFKIIKIILPVLITILAIVDFVKIIVSGKDDDMKKAINNFTKRIVIVILFILVPMFISLIINISGVTSDYSGINDGLKAVFCIFE